MALVVVEIIVRCLPNDSLTADLELRSTASVVPSQLAVNTPVSLDLAKLLALSNDPVAYGHALTSQLFADQQLREAWLKARAYSTDSLQLRLRLDRNAAYLHMLRWETLRDLETDQPLTLHERVRLVRSLDSADLTPLVIPHRPDLRALVIVASPSDLSVFQLADLDVEREVAQALTVFGDLPVTILGSHAAAVGRATLTNIASRLRDAPSIVLLVAHGTTRSDGPPVLWLEREDGTAERLSGDAFVEQVARLTTRPLLLILASCHSAGAGYGDTLSALGPDLVRAGLAAVLGFQGDVALDTVKVLLPALVAELRRDGRIDRALAAARARLGEDGPWWQAVLWLRADGRLWLEAAHEGAWQTESHGGSSPTLSIAAASIREQIRDYRGYIEEKTQGFVGRQFIFDAIERFTRQHPRGYFILRGDPGIGKSSFAAQLVKTGGYIHHFNIRAQGICTSEQFINNLCAQLIARYKLNYPALPPQATQDAGFLSQLLEEVSRRLGDNERALIVVDALDEADSLRPGVNRLLLPIMLPKGIYVSPFASEYGVYHFCR